jgi:hypothetical protein
MENTQVDIMTIKKEEVEKKINEVGKYVTQKIKIKAKDNDESKYYDVTIDWSEKGDGSFPLYEGFLNREYFRNFYGKFKFPNEDIYAGEWKNNVKDGVGVYFYSGQAIFLGNWNNGKKQSGIQIWKSDVESSFDAFIGTFSEGSYTKGLYVSYSNTNNYIYFGNFDKNGDKNDENAFYYDSDQNMMYYGKFNDNKAVAGYQIRYENTFTENLEIKDILFFETAQNEENSVKKILKNFAIQQEEKAKVISSVTEFYSKFVQGKYYDVIFGTYYKKFKEYLNFKPSKEGLEAYFVSQIKTYKENLKNAGDKFSQII